MEYNPSLPIYLQVANSIKRDIVTGKLEPGAKLPSVRDLAVEYTINPNTVSRVYRELEMENVCFTRRGTGTFVTQDPEKVRTMRREMAGTLIYEFLEGMKQLGEGKFMLHIPETEDHDMKALVNKFNEMDTRIHTLIVENYEIKLKEKESQVMALSMQMNPHFLYNTLNTVNMMALGEGQMGISDALVRLAKMLQRTLRIRGDRWTVREELENLDDYLYIMKLRYENAFCAEVEVQEELMDTTVPFFLLQPLVENSVIHGFEDMQEGGKIKITARRGKNGKRNFVIWDNGKGMDLNRKAGTQSREHRGLNNLKDRLSLIYGEDYFMEMGADFPHGTAVYIVLPPD